MKNFSKEFELVINISNISFDEMSIQRVESLITEEEIDWNIVLSLIFKHKVVLLFNNNLNRISSELIPNFFQEKLKQISLKKLYSNLKNTQELFRIIKVFNEHKIPIITYKGPIFAYQLFGNLGNRDFGDLDFCIREADLPQIKNVLENIGYDWLKEFTTPLEKKRFLAVSPEYNFEKRINTRREYFIEPHWQLASPLFALDAHYKNIEQYSEDYTIGNNVVRAFHKDFLPILLAIHHGVKDNWCELKFFCDWAFWLTSFETEINWKNVIQLAKKFNVYYYLIVSLGVTQQLFNVKLPPTLKSDINQKRIQVKVENIVDALGTRGEKERGSLITRIWFKFLKSNTRTKIKIARRYFYYLSINARLYFSNKK